MPTYDYRCSKGHDFELVQRMSDEPRARCPVCGAKAERRISAGGGFLFKGAGFYITDYRSAEYKKKASSEGGGEGGGEGGASKSDAKKTAEGGSSKSEGKGSAGGKEGA